MRDIVNNFRKETLNLPADWQPQGLITLGWAGETREKTRAPLETKIKFL